MVTLDLNPSPPFFDVLAHRDTLVRTLVCHAQHWLQLFALYFIKPDRQHLKPFFSAAAQGTNFALDGNKICAQDVCTA